MLKPKVISLLFVLLMILQVLPAIHFGKLFMHDKCAEEMPLATDETSAEDGNLYTGYQPAQYQITKGILDGNLVAKVVAYLHHVIEIPHNHSADVVSPPPDGFSFLL